MRYFKLINDCIIDEPEMKRYLKVLFEVDVENAEEYENIIQGCLKSGVLISKVYDPLKESEFDNVCGFIADCLGIGE